MDPAFQKWLSTLEAKKIATAVQKKEWDMFLQKYPRADGSKFYVQGMFAKNHTATAEVFFKGSSGVSTSVFGSDKRYWSPEMKKALGLDDVGGFPYQLTPLKKENPLPIPAVDFTQPAPSINRIFANLIPIYVTPDTFLHGEGQRDIRTNTARTQLSDRVKDLVRWPKHEILATAAKLCSILRDARLWSFKRNI